MYETICADLDAEPIQHIGKLLVLYRPKLDGVKETKFIKRGKGLREVTIVKPSASGTKTISFQSSGKGNERVTQGGIKRAKPRQKKRQENYRLNSVPCQG